MCSAMRTLDAATALGKLFPKHLLCVSFDATDFTRDGKAPLGCRESRSLAQQEMFLRTSFEYSSRRASLFCARTTMQEQLTAHSDPFAFAASDVTIFRGSADDGYP